MDYLTKEDIVNHRQQATNQDIWNVQYEINVIDFCRKWFRSITISDQYLFVHINKMYLDASLADPDTRAEDISGINYIVSLLKEELVNPLIAHPKIFDITRDILDLTIPILSATVEDFEQLEKEGKPLHLYIERVLYCLKSNPKYLFHSLFYVRNDYDMVEDDVDDSAIWITWSDSGDSLIYHKFTDRNKPLEERLNNFKLFMYKLASLVLEYSTLKAMFKKDIFPKNEFDELLIINRLLKLNKYQTEKIADARSRIVAITNVLTNPNAVEVGAIIRANRMFVLIHSDIVKYLWIDKNEATKIIEDYKVALEKAETYYNTIKEDDHVEK